MTVCSSSGPLSYTRSTTISRSQAMEADTTIRAKRAASLNDTTETRSQKKPKSEPPAPQDGALGVEGLRVGSDSDIQVLPAGGLDDSTESTISQNPQRKSQESAMTQEAIASCVDQVKHYVHRAHNRAHCYDHRDARVPRKRRLKDTREL